MFVSKCLTGLLAGAALTYAVTSNVAAQPADDSAGTPRAPIRLTIAPVSSLFPAQDTTTSRDDATAPATVADTTDYNALAKAAAEEVIEIDDTAPAESASSVHITRDDLSTARARRSPTSCARCRA